MLTKTREGYSVPPAIPAIELIDVHTMLGEEWVLRGVSFGVQSGRITALLGPTGVGKTTCLRHITGLLVPDEGDVLIEGRSTLAMRRAKRLELSKRFGVLLQGSGLYGSALWESITVEENMLQQIRLARVDWDEADAIARARDWLRVVGLSSSADLMPAQLSSGMRRRVGLARALVCEPQFAVLDSFELGVDPVRIGKLCRVIERSHERFGGTYLIATQNIAIARRLADEVVVLWNGRVIIQGPTEEVLASELPEVRQLIAGEIRGPLGFHGDRRLPAPPTPDGPPNRIAEQGLELPLPLVFVALLAVATVSVLTLGNAHPAELAVIAGAWIAALVYLARR